MRMWNVPTEMLCRQHLLGEHNETHAFVGTINKGISIRGYLDGGLLEMHTLRDRHEALAREMERRGYNHKSPLPAFDERHEGYVDIAANKKELSRRCVKCRDLQDQS